jgi:acetyl/propionyl-CoA carboxylase alpha subunit/acetyl-CoA carboxylase carboxyltransferase component
VNRGEAAIRFLQAVRDLNRERGLALETVALYTDPDRDAVYVQNADQAVRLGSPWFFDPEDLDESGRPRRKSRYLDLPRVAAAMREAGCDAAWTGWGFVAELPEFPELCTELGIVCIGPPAAAMRLLGDKIGAKRLAESAGVDVGEWSGGPVSSVEEALEHGRRIGYPLLIKATAGGGGRGIRLVRRERDLADAFRAARAESAKSFGDDTVFLERLVENARHVEVQILADHHGTVWAIGVRDCSVQRRHQKVIEEAPCPVLSPEREAELREAARALARRAGYRNAGTVEFLYHEASGRFTFLEMNTRLQVEHPVTEMTTDLDLVKLQIAVAAGERLGPEPPPTRGHAIEARLNAEDPHHEFCPAPGKLLRFRPGTGPGIRTDWGVREGDVVPGEFDSMIAKMIAYGVTREEARARLERALEDSHILIEGGATNRNHLIAILRHPDFIAGRVDTGWLDRAHAAGELNPQPSPEAALVVAAIDSYEAELRNYQANFFAQANRGTPELPQRAPRYAFELQYAGHTYRFKIGKLAPCCYRLEVDGEHLEAKLERGGRYLGRLHLGGTKYLISSITQGEEIRVDVRGNAYLISRESGGTVRAPAPAMVLAIHVAPGDRVRAGDLVVTLEAMKMEMNVRAPVDGVVRRVPAAPNVQVNAGAALVELEPDRDQTASRAVGERVSFQGIPPLPESTGRFPASELNPLMLGFDVEEEETRRVLEWLRQAEAPPTPELLAALEHAVELYLDIEELFVKQDTRIVRHGAPVLSARELLLQYLRRFNAEGAGLPEEFLDKLRRALLHYGITSLKPRDGLRDALLWLFKSHFQLGAKNNALQAILAYYVRHAEHPALAQSPRLRPLLNRIVRTAWGAFPALADSARQVHYAVFDAPAISERRRQVLSVVDQQMQQLLRENDPRWRGDLIAELVGSPQPLLQHFATRMRIGAAEYNALVLEIMLRRFWQRHELTDVQPIEDAGETLVAGTVVENGRSLRVLAALCAPDRLAACLAEADRKLADLHADHAAVDLYLLYPAGRRPASWRDGLRDLLQQHLHTPRKGRICIIALDPEAPAGYATFERDGEEWSTERELFRDLHPSIYERLELWRLKNFRIQRLPSPEVVHLFYCQSLSNERDQRFFAIAEVRDCTPWRDPQSGVVHLPDLEHVLTQACYAMRQAQAEREARSRLIWNRVLLHVRPPIPLSRDELVRLARSLQPPTEGLGIEKVVLRGRLKPSRNAPEEEILLTVSQVAGQERQIRFQTPHDRPVSPLSPYNQKVVRALRSGMTYAYEIVRMLTPADGTPSQFPKGEFEEYDLAEGSWDDPRLVSVRGRPPGENRANVVVGLIRNFTELYPEGMQRVIILGDGTREMGSLAAPECARIIGALRLAQERGIPIEWFPISSGAKISMESGTENLDWTARTLRRIIEATQVGQLIHIVVDGINVGAQSYWNAEATMLQHTKGCLIMTARGAMLLTGKKALDYSGGVSAEDNLGIGGFERIMGVNGQAQYFARDLPEACRLLFQQYQFTYRAPGERFPRRRSTSDPFDRDVRSFPCEDPESDFPDVGAILDPERNPGKKKPFAIRDAMRALIDGDSSPLERWQPMRDAEIAVVWDAHLGGIPVSLCGIESRPIPRHGYVPGDGPDSWLGGTLFPLSSKKIARAINAASGVRPVVFLANLSGFDGSPESLRKLQLEYGAEIGRAIVNFDGPIVFCVIARYHGGAYVVFSKALNENLQAVALEGTFASVIGGAPAAAVVFSREVRKQTMLDPRIRDWRQHVDLSAAPSEQRPLLRQQYAELYQKVFNEKLSEIAERFDGIHTVHRAHQVGSLDMVIPPAQIRPTLIRLVEAGMNRAMAGHTHHP